MKRVLLVVIILAAALSAAPSASAAPGVTSVSAPAVVKPDGAGQSSAVVSGVFTSGPDGGGVALSVREWGTREVLGGLLMGSNLQCQTPPSYRCTFRVRLRDLQAVQGRKLVRNRLYVVEASFNTFGSGPSVPFGNLPRFALFWTQ